MARISTYETIDGDNISRDDLIVGSQRLGIDINGPIYKTKSYRVGDLADFFGINVDAVATQLGSYTDGVWGWSSALATQTLSVVTTAGFASASYITNLEAQVGTFNADGSLTLTEAFANQVLNVTTTTEYASTSFATNLASSLGTYNADGTLASLSSSFADNVLSTMNTSSLASASSVTQLTATLTNDYRTTTATNTQINESVATETSARASAVTALNTSINIKPNIIRATSAPSIIDQVTDGTGQSGNITTTQDPAMGSLWIDISTTAVTAADGSTSQEPKNEMYVLQGSAGSASWLKTQDASLLNVVTSAATATSSLTTLTTADIAKAEQLTKLNAQFTLDQSDPPLITGVAGVISTANNDVRNTAIATANSASATREANLSATAVKVFKQTTPPNIVPAATGSAALSGSHTDTNSLAHNAVTGDRVVGQTVTGTGISGDVVIIEITDANNIVVSSPQTIASGVVLSFNKPKTPTIGSLWYDTTLIEVIVPESESAGVITESTAEDLPKNELYVLESTGWVANPDALKASTASVKIISDASSNINGKLTAVHGVTVNAGGAIAGMKLIADGTTGSTVKFQADKFVLQTGNANSSTFQTPFAVVGSEVLIDGSLKIGGAAGARIDEMAVADLDLQKSSNITIAGRKIWRSSGSSSWDAQVYSGTSYKGSAVIAFSPGWNNKYLMMGLNSDPATDANYTGIDYAWYCHENGNLYIYESGVQVAAGSSYSTSNVLKIEYDGVEVKYFQDSTLVRTVSATADKVLFMDCSFYSSTPVTGEPAITHFDFAPTNHEIINRARKSQGQVGGWNITNDAITGGAATGAADGAFATSAGIKMGAAGWISSKNFYINTSGDAVFKGAVSGGTISVPATTPLFSVAATGAVTATSGTIGGWTLGGTAGLYNGRDSITSTTAGVFIGQTGIALGATGAPTFKVTSAGVMNATGATISGAITATSLTLSEGVTISTGDVTGLPTSYAPTDARANLSSQNNPSNYAFGGNGFALANSTADTGLNMNADFIGYHNGTAFKTYMANNGDFFLSGTNGSLAWDSTSDTLAITGAINATSGSFTGNITSDSGNIGGWVIDGGQFSSPQVSNVSRIKISPTGGISVNDTSGNPKCVITTGDLTDLTAGNPSLPDFNGFTLPGNDLSSADDYSYGGTDTFSVAKTGTYSGTIAYTTATPAYITPAGFSGYMSVSLGYQIATDSSFNNVISSSVITSVSSSTNASAFSGTLPARTIGIQATFLAASNHYARYYYRRSGGGNKVTNFLASSIPSVNDTSLAMAADATELTDRGFQVVSDSNTYLRIKRASQYYNTSLPYVQIGGALSTTGNITAYYSDGRLKEVEGKIENALDKIDKINGIYYKENELARGFGFKNEKRQVGLIAQEVNEILPEVIDLAPFDMDVDDGTSKSGENYMTLSYSKLVPLLVECIKELKKEVEDLKKNN